MRHRQLPDHASPLQGEGVETTPPSRPLPHHYCTLALRVYHWLVWLLLVLLLLIQPLGFVWRRVVATTYITYGRLPTDGIFTVSGSTNDAPFTDRAIVCSLVGRLYKPVQLSTLLATVTTVTTVTTDTSSVHGYRVIAREGLALAPDVRDFYGNTCDQIATTIDGMLDACTTLGYNVSSVDFLHIAVGETLTPLPSTLPVLVLPYYDSGRTARYVIPSHDGRACVFRLLGKYTDAALPNSYLSGVDRLVRETKAAEWLGLHTGGVWRHGWVHDPANPKARWYADVYGTSDALGLRRRQIDTATGQESDCLRTTACDAVSSKAYWGKDLFVITQSLWATSIVLLDETRNGLFLYQGEATQQTFSTYRLELLLANVSVTMLLFRWLVALWATHRVGQTIGVGALACARSFHVLPVIFLPRLKLLFAAFWTVGYVFEGDQRTLSETWFVMYPAIAECTLLLFSLLNLTAKLLRRRTSDALFGPTLLALCLLHRLRWEIASSGWFEMSGRVATMLSSSRFADLKLVDLLSPTIIYQLNGATPSICGLKVALLLVNLVPLFLWHDNTTVRSFVRAGGQRCHAEKALALRLACSGGLGRSPVYETKPFATLDTVVPLPFKATSLHKPPPASSTRLVAYELVRAGYVLLGRDALVSTRDWFWFMVSAPFRCVGIPMRHLRMVTFTVSAAAGEEAEETVSISERPTMCRVTDERFHATGAWEISVRPLQ